MSDSPDVSLLNESVVATLNAVCQSNTVQTSRRSNVSQFPANYPAVYIFRLEKFLLDDLYSFYAEEMIPGIISRDVGKATVNYINKVIKSSGWSAVWRSTKSSSDLDVECDFVVKVLSVSEINLEADVMLRDVLTDLETVLEDEQKEKISNLMKTKFFTVPLVELYVCCEDEEEEEYLKTAIAIEHVRFFYSYLWRPWDEEGDDEHVAFVDVHLSDRLKFFSEFKNKSLSLRTISRAKYLLETGWLVKEKLDALRSQLMLDGSNSEIADEDGSKISELWTLQLQMEQLQKEMAIIEKPVTRALLVDKVLNRGSETSNFVDDKKPLPTIHFVSSHFYQHDLKEFAELDLEPAGAELKFHHTLIDAISASSSCDTIFLQAGVNPIKDNVIIDKELTIKGVKCGAITVLEGQNHADTMISCLSPRVTFQDVMLRSRNSVLSLLSAYGGNVEMHRCIIKGENTQVALIACKGSMLNLYSSRITDCDVDGVRIEGGSKVTLQDSQIFDSNNNAIVITAVNEDITEKVSEIALNMQNVVVEGSGAWAMLVETQDNFEHREMVELGGDTPEDELRNVFSRFPWLHCGMFSQINLSKNKGIIKVASRTSSQSSLSSATEEEKRVQYAYLRSVLEESSSYEELDSDSEDGSISDSSVNLINLECDEDDTIIESDMNSL